MKTSPIAFVSLLALALLGNTIQAQTIIWTNTASGGWNTAANWSPNTVPASNNTVIINEPGVTVTLNGTTTAGAITLGTNTGSTVTLSLAGQTLMLYGPLTVNATGSFTVDSGVLIGSSTNNVTMTGTVGWTGGSLEGTLTLGGTGTLNVTGTGGVNISGCIFTNNGTVVWTNGTIQSGNGTIIYNNGLWNMQSDQTLNEALGGGATFNNYGTLRKSGGVTNFTTGTIFGTGVVFNQLAGEIDVQNGTNGLELAFQGGGSLTGGYITTNQNGLTILSEGNFTVNGTVTGTNTWEDAGNLIGANVINGALTWVGGNWNGASSVTITANSTLLLVGAGAFDIEACQITNNGTVQWTNGTIQGGSGTVIDNYGLWNMPNDQTLNDAYGGAATFNNYGTLRKSGGVTNLTTGTIFASGVVFNQLAGEIDVQSGTNGLEMAFEGGGALTGGYITTNQNGLTILSEGNFTVNGTVTGTNTWEDAGNLTGANVINGALTWVGGNWNSATSVTVTPNSTLLLVGTGAFDIEACQITNNGTVQWTNATIQGGNGTVIDNNGLWNMPNDQTLNDAYGGAATFNNYGTLRKSGGVTNLTTGTIFASGVVFNQLAGEIDVQNGTNGLELAFEGGGALTGGYITTNQFGLTVLSEGSFTVNGTVTGTNTWEDTGNLTGANVINGALTWVGGNWGSAVVTVSSNSTLIINTPSGSHDMSGCILTNNGTVNWSGDELYTGGNSAFYNYGVWNAQDDHTIENYYGNAALFNNYGTFLKSGGTNSSHTQFSTMTFNQIAGVVNVETGNLVLAGTENFTGGSTVSSPGTIYLSTGSFTINGTTTTANVVDNPGTMAGVNVINGALTWQSGSWDSAVVTVATNSTLIINTASGNHLMDGCILTNNGTVNWSGDELYAGGNSAFYNYGVWDAQDDQTIENYYGNAALFNNYGTFLKSGGTNSSHTQFSTMTFNQIAGVVNVETGNLVLAGTENFTGGSTVLSPGTIYLSTGSFTVNGTTTTANVVDNPGAMVGVNVINGALTWQSGSWGSAVVTVTTNSTLIITTNSGNHLMSGCILTNNGTINWSADELYAGGNSAFYNYGVWNAQDDQTIENYYGNAALFNNYGTFRKTGTSGGTSQFQSGMTVTNIGTLDSQIGNINVEGAYNLTNGTLNFGINSLTNYGTITLAGAAALTGTVSANLNNGYQPIDGNSFTNLFYSSYTGAFTNAVLPFLDAWTTNYAATYFYLHVLNARPTLDTVSNQTVEELTPLTVTNTATDPDLPPQTLTFSLVSAPAGMTINSSTGVMTWTPPQTNSPSTNTITVAVTDNGTPPLSATNSFQVIVTEVNVAPTLPVVANQTIDVLALLTVTNTATNSNSHSTNIGYRVTGPSGVIISTNGIITWTPAQSQGPHTNIITTMVTNFNPYDSVHPHLTSTNTFQVIVYAPTLAAIGNFTVNAGQTVSFTASATDNDPTRTLTFSLGAAPSGATINSSSGLFSWRPPVASANTTNTNVVELMANSTPPDTVSNTFTIIVNPLTPVTLTPISKTSTNFEIQVAGPIGPDYILQSVESLSGQSWSNLSSNTPVSSPFDVTTTNVSTSNEFYRIKLGP